MDCLPRTCAHYICYGLHGLQVLWTSWTMDMESEFLFTHEGISKLWASAVRLQNQIIDQNMPGRAWAFAWAARASCTTPCSSAQREKKHLLVQKAPPSIQELVTIGVHNEMLQEVSPFQESWQQFHHWVSEMESSAASSQGILLFAWYFSKALRGLLSFCSLGLSLYKVAAKSMENPCLWTVFT